MIPSDDPLMALAMLSGRADSTIEAGFMGHALGVTEEQAREEYERRIAPVDDLRRALIDEDD